MHRCLVDDSLGLTFFFIQHSTVPRSEYMRRLARDLGEHYGYIPELTDMFLSMFSPAGALCFGKGVWASIDRIITSRC